MLVCFVNNKIKKNKKIIIFIIMVLVVLQVMFRLRCRGERVAACAALMLSAWGAAAPPVHALAPAEVVVVANRAVAVSEPLARYYMERRAIPAGNLVLLATTGREACDRQEYEKAIAAPLRAAVAGIRRRHPVRCLVSVMGVPLKIKETAGSLWRRGMAELRAEKRRLQEALAAGKGDGAAVGKRLEAVKNRLNRLAARTDRAAVDSELAMLFVEAGELAAWRPNPLFWGSRGREAGAARDVLMVARLDGPAPAVVRRMIDDSLAVEKAGGLRGIGYFDARWPRPDKKNLSGYALYDASIHEAAAIVRRQGLGVILDERRALFQPGEAPDAALYCGWYSLGHYIDAFDWRRGAVGYHIASAECATLRKEDGEAWCKRLLEDGVSATIGPVYEPYVQGFPLPHLFFSALVAGHAALAEAFIVSQPYLSWQTILVGDPLYRPFPPSP